YVQAWTFHEWNALDLPEKIIVLLHHTILIHGLLDHRLKCSRQLRTSSTSEIVRRRSIAPGQNLPGIFKTHRRDSVNKNLLCGWCGSLGCSVHAQNKSVHLWPIPDGSETLLHGTQISRHEDLYCIVPKVSVTLAGEFDGIVCADLKSFSQP